MPSFGTHNRNYSWPPSLHHVSHLPHIRSTLAQQSSHQRRDSSKDTIADIDEDPFSHFLSPINADDDPDDPMSMSAGITNTESIGSKKGRFYASLARRWAQSVGPKERNSVHYHPYSRRHRNTLSSHTQPTHQDYNIEVRAPQDVTMTGTSPPIPTIVVTEWDDDPIEDRAQQLLIAAQRLRRRRRTSRTLSGHRHSWQEPSPDLYTVLEEGAHHEVAVESASEDDMYDDSDVESLNSEDEALYAEDDDCQFGWPDAVLTRPSTERARL